MIVNDQDDAWENSPDELTTPKSIFTNFGDAVSGKLGK
jgi:hypothetical protein